jgi:ribosomal protein S18 acetylase RimI-like enzyme
VAAGGYMEIHFKKCLHDDLTTLQALSRRTYDVTFRHLNTPDNMKAYLDEAFSTEKLRGELQNEESAFYFLYADGTLAGYLKLNESGAQTDLNDPASLELERIYVSPEFQGKGLGGVLMDKALEIAGQRKKAYIWLGVWEKNGKAIAFYKKNGFFEAGKHTFVMGDDVQSDFVMRKDLES